MKKVMWAMVILVLALTALAPQTKAQTSYGVDVYVVQQDDNLYNLAGAHLGDPLKWGQVLGANPFLKEPGRVFEKDGKTIVLIRPGEQLFGLQALGITPEPIKVKEFATPTPSVQTAEGGINWWKWIVLGFLGLMLLAWLIEYLRRRRELGQNPVTSGPPIIAGGVQPNETERLDQAMRAAAVGEYVRLNPGVERHTVRVERVGPIESGLISGSGMVGYADRARPRTINPPQPGYRARFLFPDGREDNLMSLQGCMNPCYYGEGLSGFTFEPTQQVLPTPEPERPAPAPAPHPAFAVRRIREAAQVENQNTIAFGDDVMVFPLGYHLSVDRSTNAITLESNAVRMTLNARPNEQAATGDVTSTGTDAS